MTDDGLWTVLSEVLVITKSALACTVTAADPLLSALFGSITLLLTVALLLITVPSGTLEVTATVTVIAAEPNGARLPKVQVSGCSGLPGIPGVQEPAVGVTDKTLVWPGIVSFTTTPVAFDGQALLNVMT